MLNALIRLRSATFILDVFDDLVSIPPGITGLHIKEVGHVLSAFPLRPPGLVYHTKVSRAIDSMRGYLKPADLIQTAQQISEQPFQGFSFLSPPLLSLCLFFCGGFSLSLTTTFVSGFFGGRLSSLFWAKAPAETKQAIATANNFGFRFVMKLP